MCNMTLAEKAFYDALKGSTGFEGIRKKYPEVFVNVDDERPYYGKLYKKILKKEIKDVSPNASIHKGVAALASSARLAALDFVKHKDVELEKTLTNDIGANTEMDAVIGNTYYECKCQEILKASHDRLSIHYKTDDRSRLFKELMGTEGLSACSKYTNKKNEEFLQFPISALGIDVCIIKDKDYHSLHFDLKQMICHLIAMAKNNKKPSVLQYIFYVPFENSIEGIKEKTKLYEVYLELEKEIEAIWDKNNKIGRFCKEHEITLAAPAFKNIKLVKDFVLEELIKKNKPK